MEKSQLTDKEIELMNSVAKGLLVMPDNRMALSTMAMTLMMLHRKNDNSGLIPNILGIINSLKNNLCEKHQRLFLEELKDGIEDHIISKLEKISEPES